MRGWREGRNSGILAIELAAAKNTHMSTGRNGKPSQDAEWKFQDIDDLLEESFWLHKELSMISRES